MSELVVRPQNGAQFLDKVIQHGIASETLSKERRQIIQQEIAGLYPGLCHFLKTNPLDIGNSLEAVEILFSFLSVAIEKKSQGNATLAVEILNQEKITSLIMEIMEEIKKTANQISEVAAAVKRATTSFGYSVEIIPVSTTHPAAKELLLFQTEQAAADFQNRKEQRPTLSEVIRKIKTLADLKTWQALVDDLYLEWQVSHVFLPWAQLKKEAHLEYGNSLGDHHLVWTSETLLITMAASFVRGGSNLVVGRAIRSRRINPYNELTMTTVLPFHMIENVEHALKIAGGKYFAETSTNCFLDYLDTAEFPFEPNAIERRKLQEMWHKALAIVLHPPATKGKKRPLGFWLTNIHLDVDMNTLEKIMFGFERRQAKKMPGTTPSKQSYAHRLIEAVGKSASIATISRLLSKVNWTEALETGEDESLILVLDPAQILSSMPLLPELVDELCLHWQTEVGERTWRSSDKEAMVKRVAQGGSSDFWQRLNQETIITLIANGPQYENLILDRTS